MAFAIFFLASILTLFVGFIVQRKNRRATLYFIFTSIIAIATRLILVYVPTIDAKLFAYEWYPDIEACWFLPFSFFIFGVSLSYVKSRLLFDALLVVEGVTLVLFSFITYRELTTDHQQLSGTLSEDGVCYQTSGYSCGAAAAVTFLNHYGIVTTEREMAQLSKTTGYYGTSACGLLLGLSKKLPGGRKALHYSYGDHELLRRVTKPCLVHIKYARLVNHWIVIQDINTAEVMLKDSLKGSYKMSLEKFKDIWNGVVIWSDSTLPK